MLSKGFSKYVYTFFDKKTGSDIILNGQTDAELHKLVTKKIQNKKSLLEI